MANFDTALSDGNFAYAGGAFHDGFSDFVANEHIDWTNASDSFSTSFVSEERSGNIIGAYVNTTLSPSGSLTGTLRNYSLSFNAIWDSNEDGDAGANRVLLYGILGQTQTTTSASGDLSRLSGGRFANYHYGTGTVGQMDVVYSLIRNDGATNESGDITNAYNYIAAAYTDKDVGIIGNRYGFYVSDFIGGGLVTNQYGVYIEALTGATNNKAIYLVGSGQNNGIFMNAGVVKLYATASILETSNVFKAGGYQSSDGSAGITGTVLPTSTLTVKNGLITAII
jgi:hypothetical protein